jgi:hypothetical protein
MTKHYMVESPHTKATCLQALDEVSARGKDFLLKFSWGCMDGDHTGYALLDGTGKSEIKKKLPSVSRDKSKIVAVDTFSEDQIRSFHTA